MTAQISEFLRWQKREYSIIAVENYLPFSPEQHGFEPVAMHTACWRGYYCRYEVTDSGLVLDELNICLGAERPIEWLGKRPEQDEFFQRDKAWKYRGMNLSIPYDGGIVIGSDFMRDFYVHMGVHRPHCHYREVWELVFQKGLLTGSTDYSARMAGVRESIREAGSKDPSGVRPSKEEIAPFVEDAFSLKYEKKWA